MFRGSYNFFDYKYNIAGYTGQDFGGPAQWLYLAISFILMVLLLFLLRKSSREKVLKIIKGISLFLVVLYVGKTTWETIYDIKYTGSFNTGLLPLDTCSIVMFAGILAGYAKGKIQKISECWLATGSIVGGIATMVVLNAFKYYPFLSFGAFYSMIWHFLMVFIGLLLIVTNYVEMKYSTIINGFILQFVFSLVVIPLDFIFNWDFMMFLNLGGIPIFEDVATNLTSLNLQFLNPILMLALYFAAFNIVFLIPLGIKKIIQIRSKK